MQSKSLDKNANAFDNDEMECIRIKPARVPVYLQFTESEVVRFKGFLRETGRKAGPWLKTLVIKAMDAEQGLGDGAGQAAENPAGRGAP